MSMRGKLGLMMAMAAMSGIGGSSYADFSEQIPYRNYSASNKTPQIRMRSHAKPLNIGSQKRRRKLMRQVPQNLRNKKFKR